MTTERTGNRSATRGMAAPTVQTGQTANAVLLAALGVLWAGAGWRLQMVWSHVPDYAFGWAVPVLAVFLLWERWPDQPAASEVRASARGWWWAALAAALLLLGITRLVLEPFPAWPMMLWLFTAAAVSVTLGLLALAGGWRTARHFAFPVAFIATALPWPGVLNAHFIAPLRETLAAGVAQAVNLLGYPAIAHGTVIEVGHGYVGVEEACSGIRSLQAAIMVALFLGELNRFSWRRRLAVLAAGVVLALGSNGVRTLFLAWQSAMHGPAAVAAWHDPAGYALLVVCLGGLVALGWSWRKYVGNVPARGATGAGARPWRGATAMAWAVVGACVVIEAGTQAWYAQGDRAAGVVTQLTAKLPEHAEGFQEDPFDATMQALLLCDTHEVGHWTARDGQARAGYVLEWRSGQSARFSTALHNPTVCLPMSGKALERERGIVPLSVDGVALPFRAYVFSSERGPMRVYYLQWDVRAGESFATRAGADGLTSWFAQQWQEARRARRNFEAMVIGVAVWGASDDQAADRALEGELPGIVAVRLAPHLAPGD